MKELSYDIKRDFGIIEEHPTRNQALTLREVSWGNREPKIEIREINIETNTPYKGIGFYTREGLTSLCKLLISNGLVKLEDLQNIEVIKEEEKEELKIITSEELLTIEED